MPAAERRRRQQLDMTVDQCVNCRGGGMPQILGWRRHRVFSSASMRSHRGLTTVCRSFAPALPRYIFELCHRAER